MFKDKILLITGGTGSFGNAVLNRFLNTDIKEIRIFSRDEKKQDDMRTLYQNDKLKFFIGDVRDLHSINDAMYNVDLPVPFGPMIACTSLVLIVRFTPFKISLPSIST